MKNSNSINNFATAQNLVVTDVSVQAMNPIIFSTSFVPQLGGSSIVKDGKDTYRIDIVSNTSTKVTPKIVAAEAKAALLADDGSTPSSVSAAINYGLIKKITMAVNEGDATNGAVGAIAAFAKDHGLKVSDVEIVAQNEVIFQTKGINNISGLDQYDGQYFKLDTVKNTATLINAEAIAEAAKADILKGKTTDLTNFVQTFNLIASVTMKAKKASDDV